MNRTVSLLMIVALAATTGRAFGQTENPDFSIRADFRDASDESVGNAKFLIKSRFLQVYYGGVSRKDEYRFQVELDDPSLASQSFNVFLQDFQVGTLSTNAAGFLDQTYRSDWKADDAPDLPLPTGFPELVNVGDVVSVYNSTTSALLFSSPLVEEFMRGDVDHDGDVDAADFDDVVSHFSSSGLGPASGDLTGDNSADGADILQVQRTYYGVPVGHAVSAVPEPTGAFLCGLAIAALGARRKRTR